MDSSWTREPQRTYWREQYWRDTASGTGKRCSSSCAYRGYHRLWQIEYVACTDYAVGSSLLTRRARVVPDRLQGCGRISERRNASTDYAVGSSLLTRRARV